MGKVKRLVSIILAAVAVVMGVAVAVLTIIGSDVSEGSSITMLAIGVAALGILALNNVTKGGK